MWDDYFSFGDIVAWFEKQGGQPKEATYTHEVETGNGNIKSLVTEKVQLPKFKVGDWVVYECGEETATLQIARIVGKTYVFSDGTTLSVADEDTLRLWDINKDAKGGDVLYAKSSYFKEYLFMFSSFTGDNVISTHFGYDVFHGTFDKKLTRFGRKEDFISVTPATKGQRDLLFQKMKETGYEWDAEKKKLKKIVAPIFHIGDVIVEIKPNGYGQPVRVKYVDVGEGSYYCKSDDGKRFLSFPIISQDEYELVKQVSVWSEEDEAKIVKLKSFIAQCKGFNKENRNKAFDLIDSIKPRHTWKPCEQDILLLERIANGKSNQQDFQASLGALIGQLKKLMEE